MDKDQFIRVEEGKKKAFLDGLEYLLEDGPSRKFPERRYRYLTKWVLQLLQSVLPAICNLSLYASCDSYPKDAVTKDVIFSDG
jgi:hypothetical protein